MKTVNIFLEPIKTQKTLVNLILIKLMMTAAVQNNFPNFNWEKEFPLYTFHCLGSSTELSDQGKWRSTGQRRSSLILRPSSGRGLHLEALFRYNTIPYSHKLEKCTDFTVVMNCLAHWWDRWSWFPESWKFLRGRPGIWKSGTVTIQRISGGMNGWPGVLTWEKTTIRGVWWSFRILRWFSKTPIPWISLVLRRLKLNFQ